MNILEIPGFTDPFSSISHLAGALFYLVLTPFLLKRGKGNKGRMASLIIYSFGLVFLFSMSGVYHLLSKGGAPRYVLRHLDYAGIWLLIASTFTPLHTILFRGKLRWGILLTVWPLAITGLTLQMIFFDVIPEWLTLSFFLSLGWLGLVSLLSIKKTYNIRHALFIAYGGLSYSLGASFDFIKWPTLIDKVLGPHEVFHIFVFLGSFFHWMYIYRISKRAISPVLNINLYQDKEGYEAVGVNESIKISGKDKKEVIERIHLWCDANYARNMLPSSICLKKITRVKI